MYLLRIAGAIIARAVPARLAPALNNGAESSAKKSAVDSEKVSQTAFAHLHHVMAVVLVGFLVPAVSQAQVSTHIPYDELIKRSKTFASLDENLFGDAVNLQDGSLAFTQSDVVLETNSQLKVSIGRKTPSASQGLDEAFAVFGLGWEPNIPFMMGTYDTRDGWNSNGSQNRCSNGFVPTERMGPYPYYYTKVIKASMYWHGISINIPGLGEEKLLNLNSGQVLPVDGKTYRGTTKSAWRVSCLSSVKNRPGEGEGFSVTVPDGTIYHFDWMATRNAIDLTDNGNYNQETGDSTDAQHLLAPLTDVYLYATKVEDRFGNFVTYTYDPASPHRIKSIASNDGVRLDVEYNSSGQISLVTANNRRWAYSYAPDQLNYQRLSSISLPDSSEWKFAHQRPTGFLLEERAFYTNACNMDPGRMVSTVAPDPTVVTTITMTHPSGAQGEFKLRPLFHGTNNTPGGCDSGFDMQDNIWYFTYGVPAAYVVNSLSSKRIFAPAMAERSWQYMYYPSWSFDPAHTSLAGSCGSPCPSTSQTTVTTNDGVLRRYAFGNDYFKNAGQLIAEAVEQGGATLQASTYSYLSSSSGQPFPDNAGDIPTGTWFMNAGTTYPYLYGNPLSFLNRPVKTVTLQQDGVTFTRTVNSLDAFARPVSVTRSSSLGYARTDSTEYYDNTSKWLLGQIKRTTSSGIETARTDYDNSNALPIRTYEFGKLQQSFTFDTSAAVETGQRGTLSTATDGNSNVTTFSNWKRGIPRLITHPDSTTSSAVVYDSGWIASTTDESGAVTGYGYDAMGRLTSITYPTEDNGFVWTSQTTSFVPVSTSEYGLHPGHWRQSSRLGNQYIDIYYDALWRPVLEVRKDSTDPSTVSQIVKRYDTSGRLSFQSYPTQGVADFQQVLPGVSMTYDGLGRSLEVKQDSELGVLTTKTDYKPGFKTEVTNPRGKKTITSYMVFDQPSTDLPMTIEHPEGTYTEIVRDAFGKPESVTRLNANGSVSLTRSFEYHPNYETLCKIIEPETGATVMNYDAAGNLSWTASGLSALTNPDTCNLDEGWSSGRRVSRTYDSRNRIKTLTFPDGNGNQTWQYWPTGLVKQISTANDNGTVQVVNAYTYNKRGLLTGEAMSQPGYTWSLGYGYNAMGHQAVSLTQPSGETLQFDPNALGQPRQVTSPLANYATGVSYYPNGAVRQFTYGNGVVHTMTQNSRQLPATSVDGGITSLAYTYDKNANVSEIRDLARGTNYNRQMQYDDLDRLTSATSISFGGSDYTHRYTYDVLDNLKSSKLAGGKDYASYNYEAGTNRLLSIQDTAGATFIGLGYDAQGNLNNKNGQSYVFDMGNRLRQFIKPLPEGGNDTETYRYDGHGRRVRASAPLHGGDIRSQYGLDGVLRYQQDDRQDKVFNHIYLDGSLIATRETAYGSSTHSIRYQHTDALGTPVAVSNALGQAALRTDYEPYGKSTNRDVDGIGYAGHVVDGVTTGLAYMQQRYYDPQIGRFLSVDPVAAREGGDNFNRYAYAFNNPYKFTDPDGRESGAFYTNPQYRMAAPDLTPEQAEMALVVQVSVLLGPLAPEAVGALRTFVSLRNAARQEQPKVDPPKPADKTIYRMGESKESPTRLGKKAAEAESVIGTHGVSGSTTKPAGPCSSASCSSLESAGFPVRATPTKKDPGHVTIELPKPVTKEVADKLNKTLGR